MDPEGLARVGHSRARRAVRAGASLVGIAAIGATVAGATAAAAPVNEARVLVYADRDDDDADGTPDGEEDPLPMAGRTDLVPLDKRFAGAILHPLTGGDRARIVVDGRPVAWDKPLTGAGFVQGLSAGVVSVVATKRGRQEALEIHVRGIAMRDGSGTAIDMARAHASLERTPPVRVDPAPDATYEDPDALRFTLEVSDDVPTVEPREIALESVSALGNRVDVLPKLAAVPNKCAKPRAGVACFTTAPVRFVIDDVDRNHPLVEGRSIRAEVGGAITVRLEGRKAQQIRVSGPRVSPIGPIGRLKAELRPFVVRVTPGGAPAIGGSDAGAIAALRAELGAASAIWGQCGVTFGETRALDVKVVDPPPAHLVSIGDDVGLPASGGEIRIKVDGKPITLPVVAGATADRVASDLARAVERAGFVAIVSPNARIAPGAAGSVDVSVRHKDNGFASVDAAAPGASISTDPTLTVRIGAVDLSDGLQHFTDMDAMAGTLEERTLLKAFDDGDPRTIEVVVVPLFAGGGRIGESFIGSDLSSLRNVVLLDRAGIRARKSSLTLAHELGHVLMDMPGHPDDFGVDTPTLLMDSDASDASPFGPRRLTLEECVRVVKQAGPKARMPLLTDWPLTPIPPDTRPLVGN